MRDGKQGGAARFFISECNSACLRQVFFARMHVRYKPCLLSKSCGNVYVRYSIDFIALRYTIYGYRAPNEKLEGAPISNLLC